MLSERKVDFLLIFALLVVLVSSLPCSATLMIQSPAAVIMDADTGQVIWEKKAHELRAPASLTKIMTALLALEENLGSEVVTVSSSAARIGGASVGLHSGERVSAQNMVLAMFYRSGNDASAALAEHISGAIPQFAQLMNRRAQSIGMTNTNFSNPHGLDDRKHYSTAYDLALLTRTALNNSTFAAMARNNYVKVRWGGQTRDLWNINSFLWRYNGSTGVKTGYTSQAGYCLAASAQKDQHTLILILLGAPTSNLRWSEAIKLLDFGFETLTAQVDCHVVTKGDTLSAISKLYDISVADIVQINNLSNPNLISVGQIIMLR